jgi:hypothetical protein
LGLGEVWGNEKFMTSNEKKREERKEEKLSEKKGRKLEKLQDCHDNPKPLIV